MSSPLRLRWAAALLLAAGGAIAAPDVTPPRPLGSTEVGYPESAHGDSVVVLELVIEADGSVGRVTVVTGDEPFARLAVGAAQAWRFTPARRGDVAIRARVRFEVRFTEPAPEPAPSAAPAASSVAPAPSASAAPPLPAAPEPPPELVVRGDKPEPASRSLSRAEVRQMPGAFGDPFRAIEALPGVTPIISGVPFFYVRGAPPGNVGYFLDGVRVPLLYHVALGPSVIHPALVERVDLFSGGYPAPYGRYAGAIVAGRTRPPAAEFHGEASVRLVDAGAFVEAPFADGRGSVALAGRYSYTGLLLTLLSQDAVLAYWDYQARVAYDVGPKDTLSVFAFGAYDYLGERKPSGRVETALGTEFHRLDLRWDSYPDRVTQVRTAVALGADRTRGNDENFSLVAGSVGPRIELRRELSSKAVLRSGVDVWIDRYSLETGSNADADLTNFFPTRTDVTAGMYADVAVEAASGVSVTPGLRADVYHSEGATALGIDPRVSARFEVSPKVRLVHAFGIAHQAPAFVIPVPGFQPAGLKGGLQTAAQYSSGVEYDLAQHFSASATAFESAFFSLSDPLAQPRNSDMSLDARALGQAYGLELSLRRPVTRSVGGFVSYTLSRSTRAAGSHSGAASFDRTHVLNAALGVDVGRRWRLGGRAVVYSGFPRSDGSFTTTRRVAPFYRLDVRAEKRWSLGKSGYWAFIFEVVNATLSKEVVSVECGIAGCSETVVGPITIPSLGVEASF